MNEKRSESTRRHFLTGKSAVDAIGNLGAPNHPDPSSTSSSPRREGRTYLVQVGRRAMACEFDVFLNAGEHEAATEHAIEALDLVDSIEDQLSVYRHRSEVSRLNQVAAMRAVPVDARLRQLLADSLELHRDTRGAFDVTSGPLIKVWGFYRREGKLPSEKDLEEALRLVGSEQVILSEEDSTVRFQQPGVEINFGGIGKGFALDQCNSVLRSLGVENFMIHGGNSSILASGRRTGADPSQGWTVGVRHPLRPERRLAEVNLKDRSMGTSGTGTQHFYHQGQKYGHIIDPRTGQPADGVLSTTVIAGSAAQADALSTAFYVMGVEETQAYCESHDDISALIITAGRQAGVIDVTPIGLDESDWKRVDD